jgi:hypothetical protein
MIALRTDHNTAAAAAAAAGKLEGKSMLEWAAAGDTGEEPRLFVVDYWAIYGLLDTLESVNAGSDRVMHAGRCVMFRWGIDSGHCISAGRILCSAAAAAT